MYNEVNMEMNPSNLQLMNELNNPNKKKEINI